MAIVTAEKTTKGVSWEVLAGGAFGIVVGLVCLALASPREAPSEPAQAESFSVAVSRQADFGAYPGASPETRHFADWIAATSDSGGRDFVIVDKKYARIYVFDAHSRLRESSPVLLGGASGDDDLEGVKSKEVLDLDLAERTTPAGRFVAQRGYNLRGEDVVWIDYDAAISMHRVLDTNPAERRLERLASESIEDNRISFGCINVPVEFFESHVRPVFAHQKAVVYVLPEIKPLQAVFPAYAAWSDKIASVETARLP
jgi:hypothetical protein